MNNKLIAFIAIASMVLGGMDCETGGIEVCID